MDYALNAGFPKANIFNGGHVDEVDFFTYTPRLDNLNGRFGNSITGVITPAAVDNFPILH